MTAPGLPSWPRLYFHPENRQAVVPLRLTTWRSWEWAYLTAGLVAWTINLLATAYVWNYLAFVENPIGRGMVTFVALGVVATVTKPLVPAALGAFLARQLFAFRSTVWFTPYVIAFKSPLYEGGVQLDRQWKDHPVLFRFDMSIDADAHSKLTLNETPNHLRRHYQSAQLLRLVIMAADAHRWTATAQNSQMRSLPMLEIDGKDVSAVATVLTGAMALTTGQSPQVSQSISGHDIDMFAQ
ncbi:hypothetical protein [Rubinisphaera margarita]|uniref:hypothetical protein n=1 Tax=Rubinisphaera margarita TaxID=2909586 RepID=UPI001EE8A475|nr:hypothetical protein [Rubinisphaera margarita]MCG6157617.1 hypothetical protein [Rubinisphaera margarita]